MGRREAGNMAREWRGWGRKKVLKVAKLKFKRKPRFGVWELGIRYPHYPLWVKKVVIRYPESWYGVEKKIEEIKELINMKKSGEK